MIRRVDVWSCALGVPWRLAVLGHGCFSLVRSRDRIPCLRPPCPRRLSHRSTRPHSHGSSHSTHCHILVVFRSAHPIAVLRFQLAWTCLPSSLLLPSKSWAVAVERDSPSRLSSICDLIDCVNLHGSVRDWDCHTGWHPHEQIKHAHVPVLTEH